MNNQRLFSFVTFFCWLIYAYNAPPQPAFAKASGKTAGDTVIMALWNLQETEATIKVTRDQFGIGQMQIWHNKKNIFSFSPNLYPQSVFELQDGNLATLWHHPDGLRHLYVFGMANGKVVRLIDASSRLDPEFVYQTNGHLDADAVKEKNAWRIKGGPFFFQRIILAETDWVLNKDKYLDRQSEVLPTSVRIYLWDIDRKVYSNSTKTWEHRLE